MLHINAQLAEFEMKMDQTIKGNKERLLLERLSGIEKTKKNTIKRLVITKYLKTKLRAFNKLK